MKYFMLIWAGLWRKKARTILTMASIVVAFLLFGLLQGINQSINNRTGDTANKRLWTTNKMSAISALPTSHLDRIQTVPGVVDVAHLSFFGGYFQDAKNTIPAYATDMAHFAKVYPELNITPAQIKAMQTTRTGVLLGHQLADKYHWKIGDRIPLGTTIWTNKEGSNSWNFDVVGIFDPTQQFARSPLAGFWLNYDYWNEAKQYSPNTVHQYIETIDNPNHATAIASAIDKLFENSPDETHSQTESAAIQAQLKQLADINFIANAIVGAVMFALLFLTANTMMQSVRERIPELAVLRTLGFSGATVSALVIVESILLCVFAAVIGLLLATVALKAVGSMLGGAGHIPGIVIITGFGIAVILALISGLPPAFRAQRLNIVDALAGR